MKRSAPLVRTAGPANASVKPKKCKACREPFFPVSSWQTFCRSEPCAVAAAEAAMEKRVRTLRKQSQQERKADRAKREASKSLGTLRRETQAIFNAYIRARDRKAGYGCICCGAPLEWDSGVPGGKVDAGHYISRGSAPELAFDERNVNAQRKSCNRPGGATRDAFRAVMVARWGEALVRDLEGPHKPAMLRADDYREMKAEYRKRLRELERG